MSHSEQFPYSYIIEYHVVEGALKERYLKGQSDRAVIFVDIGGMRFEGPTPKVIVFRCRTFSAPLITHLPNDSPIGLPYQVAGFGFPFGRRPLRRSALAILNYSLRLIKLKQVVELTLIY